VVLGLLGAFGLLLVAGGVAAVLWFALAGKKNKPTPPAAEVTADAPAGWQEFSLPEGRFRVLLPGRPSVRRQNAPSPVGPVLDTVCELNTDEMSIGVRFADFDSPAQRNVPLEQVVNDGRDAILKALGGRLVREGGFTVGNARVREAVIDSARQGRCHFRWYVRGRRLYAISVLSLHRDRAPPDDVVRRFFDSFRLTD
jgi:hypothetical protein